MNKSLSQFANIECGVPQGSVLSPILFALYFDAVANCTSGTNKVKIALFADDVVIWYTHWNKASVQANIQKVTTAFNNQCSQLGLGITLDPSLNFKYHFEKIIERCNAKLNLIRIFASFNKSISCDKLITAYKAYVLSKIQYSIIPFIYSKENAIKKIENLQNEALTVRNSLVAQSLDS